MSDTTCRTPIGARAAPRRGPWAALAALAALALLLAGCGAPNTSDTPSAAPAVSTPTATPTVQRATSTVTPATVTPTSRATASAAARPADTATATATATVSSLVKAWEVEAREALKAKESHASSLYARKRRRPAFGKACTYQD